MREAEFIQVEDVDDYEMKPYETNNITNNYSRNDQGSVFGTVEGKSVYSSI